ncbi:hypothetical protein APY03_6622 [Variovorax sp. WDL1]|nr:hypothetical protein APY03_6622 [Variovorax sp. WDL1]
MTLGCALDFAPVEGMPLGHTLIMRTTKMMATAATAQAVNPMCRQN